MAAKKNRLSLTSTQTQTAIGAELLALCQSVTEDGVLQKEEIKALRDWLRANRECDLPSVGFLCDTVERIIADKVVTREEQAELYMAIETVLPKEARRKAVDSRRKIEAKKKAVAKAVKEKQKEQERIRKAKEKEEREKNCPVWRCNFMVAGVHFENRPTIIRESLNVGPVILQRDRFNEYSRNAIAIKTPDGKMFGFVPEHEAVEAAPFLDQGFRYSAFVVKILTEARVPIPIVEAAIYRPDSDPSYIWAPNWVGHEASAWHTRPVKAD
jgi:hypothetical protein